MNTTNPSNDSKYYLISSDDNPELDIKVANENGWKPIIIKSSLNKSPVDYLKINLNHEDKYIANDFSDAINYILKDRSV